MAIQVIIPVNVLYFTKEQKAEWKNGNRDGCQDPYCMRLPNSYGFGENLVGNHFSELGYKWIHHDYNIFGGNKLCKYPIAEDVILQHLGKNKYESTRTIYNAFRNVEEPDLFIYKPDYSEIRFAESKRVDTRDKLRVNQVRALALYALLFGCKVEVFEIAETGTNHQPKPIIWEF